MKQVDNFCEEIKSIWHKNNTDKTETKKTEKVKLSQKERTARADVRQFQITERQLIVVIILCLFIQLGEIYTG